MTIVAGVYDSHTNTLTLVASGEEDSAKIVLNGKRNSNAEIRMEGNVSIENLTVADFEKVSNKFYVGPTLNSADLAQLADNALVIMGD